MGGLGIVLGFYDRLKLSKTLNKSCIFKIPIDLNIEKTNIVHVSCCKNAIIGGVSLSLAILISLYLGFAK